VIITPPAHTVTRVIGRTTNACQHDPPRRFGSPNGAFPMTNGDYLVTEINGDWADELSRHGRVTWSANPAGVLYPSDSNELYPGRYLTADYSDPGQVAEFTSSGRVVWRMGGFNQPSLALPLPNGDILLNDDFNHRVCVVDPATHRIVWQYGHTGKAGRGPGYLSDPDGVDLVPPDSLLVTHGATMGVPFRQALRRDDRVQQYGRSGRADDRAGGPLPQPLEELAVAARHGGLQALAAPHLGQVHHGVDQVRAPAGGDMAGCGVQRGPGGPGGGHRHLGRGDDLAAVPDLHVTWRVRMVGHGGAPGIAGDGPAALLPQAGYSPARPAPGRNRSTPP